MQTLVYGLNHKKLLNNCLPDYRKNGGNGETDLCSLMSIPNKTPEVFGFWGLLYTRLLSLFYLKSSSNFFSIASPRMLRARMVPSWSMSRV